VTNQVVSSSERRAGQVVADARQMAGQSGGQPKELTMRVGLVAVNTLTVPALAQVPKGPGGEW